MDEFKKNALVGSVQNVKKKLLELANHLEIDELVIITWTHDHAVQRRSYELLAEAFNLQNQSIAAWILRRDVICFEFWVKRLSTLKKQSDHH